MGKLRVLIADDHPVTIAGIRAALQKDRDVEITGEATSGTQVLPLIAHAQPDVALIDPNLTGMDGLACLARIREKYPSVKVVFFAASDEPTQIAQVLEGGACAYLLKAIDPDDLGPVLRQAVAGAFFRIGPRANGQPSPHSNDDAVLTNREREILGSVANGLSNRAVAGELWLSDQTVKFHLHNIYRKLGVRNRTEATRYAFEHGLVEKTPVDLPAT
jgi:two-component system nitrate/nitrite response regulator NarL